MVKSILSDHHSSTALLPVFRMVSNRGATRSVTNTRLILIVPNCTHLERIGRLRCSAVSAHNIGNCAQFEVYIASTVLVKCNQVFVVLTLDTWLWIMTIGDVEQI